VGAEMCIRDSQSHEATLCRVFESAWLSGYRVAGYRERTPSERGSRGVKMLTGQEQK